ncbi:MAG: NUDIX domain-containing protein [Candidatus Devosia symbiotica]|nr:NUDIX domain-containing protein [Candidatus Devosia symbiotica]
MPRPVKINSVTRLSHNWGRFDNYDVTHARRDGGEQTVTREICDHGSAAAVLLYAPGTHSVVPTRQCRLPTFLNSDPARLIEAPAGVLGEASAIAAQREALEETGYRAADLVFVCNRLYEPGLADRKMHLLYRSLHAKSARA